MIFEGSWDTEIEYIKKERYLNCINISEYYAF